jgi:hypothetical protein
VVFRLDVILVQQALRLPVLLDQPDGSRQRTRRGVQCQLTFRGGRRVRVAAVVRRVVGVPRVGWADAGAGQYLQPPEAVATVPP